jgi:hypothetical protein
VAVSGVVNDEDFHGWWKRSRTRSEVPWDLGPIVLNRDPSNRSRKSAPEGTGRRLVLLGVHHSTPSSPDGAAVPPEKNLNPIAPRGSSTQCYRYAD